MEHPRFNSPENMIPAEGKERTIDENLYAKLCELVYKIQSEFQYGGEEDVEGSLIPGKPNFGWAKQKIDQLHIKDGSKKSAIIKIFNDMEPGTKLQDPKEKFLNTDQALEALQKITLGSEQNVAFKAQLIEKEAEEKELTSQKLETFINRKIAESAPGSEDRLKWGNAFSDFKQENVAPLIQLLNDVQVGSTDNAIKEEISAYMDLLRSHQEENPFTYYE